MLGPYNIYMLIFLAYLLGSIPFGYLLMKYHEGRDIRQEGSGNIGATNVFRSGKKGLAAATLLGDLLKGFIPVLLGRYVDIPDFYLYFIALSAILGHLFPLWLSFKGGKGIATALGCYLALSPTVTLLCLITWGLVAKITRISSVAALISFFMAPLYTFILGFYTPEKSQATLMTFMLGVYFVILLTHRENIKRLLSGTEKRMGENP